MEIVSKSHKIKIGNKVLTLTLDNSYIAENAYMPSFYNPKINGTHYHALYELFIVGEEEVTICGEAYEESFKNCILVIPPLFKHYTIRKSGYQIKVACQRTTNNLETKPFGLKTNQNITTYAEKIAELLFKKSDINVEMAECFLKLILCEIALENDIKKESSYTPKSESYFEQIEEVIFDTDIRSNITLGDVAERLNLSKKQTARIIRKNYNATFAEILRERRLTAAASLLINTDISISEIVERVNFPSESYFYNNFKKAYNITPLNYRKNKRCQL